MDIKLSLPRSFCISCAAYHDMAQYCRQYHERAAAFDANAQPWMLPPLEHNVFLCLVLTSAVVGKRVRGQLKTPGPRGVPHPQGPPSMEHQANSSMERSENKLEAGRGCKLFNGSLQIKTKSPSFHQKHFSMESRILWIHVIFCVIS